MSKHTAWAWVRGMLVTANEDGSVPLNAKVVLANNRDADEIEVSEKNSALIAAAPELLEALKELSVWWASWMPDEAKEQPNEGALRVLRAAQAAIAKAEGKP